MGKKEKNSLIVLERIKWNVYENVIGSIFFLKLALSFHWICAISFIDVRTQASYQLMDEDFLGLIISCFNQNSDVSLL